MKKQPSEVAYNRANFFSALPKTARSAKTFENPYNFFNVFLYSLEYNKVASINTSHVETPFTLYRLFRKGNFSVYLIWPLKKNLIS